MNMPQPIYQPRPATSEGRSQSPLWQSPQLKEVIVAAALAGEITEQDAAEMFAEYGLKEV